MKLSEKIWVEKLAQISLTKPHKEINNPYITQQFTTLFLNELCALVTDYICYFNDLILSFNNNSNTNSVWSLFKPTQPRTGLIATREKDKLVISDEGKKIHIKMIECCLPNEQVHESLYFEPKKSELGIVNWRCVNDGQYVNPEMVARHYLSTFFVYGCKGASKTYPRLVAVGK